MKNNKGLTLVSTLVGVAVAGIAAVGISQMFVDYFKKQQSMTFRSEVQELSDEIRSIVGAQQACTNTFGGLALTGGMDHAVNAIRDNSPAPGQVRYDVGTVYGDRTLTISGMRLTNYRPGTGQSGDATFIVTYRNQKQSGLFTELRREFEIRTESDPSGTTLQSCVSTSEMFDGLWRRATGNVNNIFFVSPSSGGDVGVGVSEPQHRLHVEGGDFVVNGPNAQTVIHEDGGMELYRGAGATTSPQVKGYIDFKDDLADDYDARIGFSQTENAFFMEHDGPAAGLADLNRTFMIYDNQGPRNASGIFVGNRSSQSQIVAAGSGDGVETYSALYLAEMPNTGTPAPQTHLNTNSWVLAFKKNPGYVPDNSLQIARWSGGSMSQHMVFDPNGNVGIGNFMPQDKLHIAGGNILITGGNNIEMRQGSINMTGGGNIATSGNITAAGTIQASTAVTTSDLRLKKFIKSLSKTHIDELMKLTTRSFQWKELPELGTRWGFIAQEVERHLPELIIESDEGVKGIDYNGLVALLIMSHQNLNKKVDKNEQRLNQIEKLLRDQTVKGVK